MSRHHRNIDAPSLYPSADNSRKLTSYARASQLLCASNLVLEIAFSADTRHDFSEDYDKYTKESHGGVSIFGFSFGRTTTETDDQTHTSSYTEENDVGTLVISPKPLAQNCTLLGVLANTLAI